MRVRLLPCFLVALVAVTLSACATNPYDTEVTEAGSQAPIERELDNPDTPDQGGSRLPNPATIALLASADEASANGNHGGAITYLERAVRMQPRDAGLWTRLAAAYLANDEIINATRHVRKAIALAADDDAAARDAWLTMADIKEAEGNLNEARSIRQRWVGGRG